MSTLAEDLAEIKTQEEKITRNKVARFAYTEDAYVDNDADGVESFDITKDNNIPLGTAEIMKVNSTVVDRGFRSQASSITRMLMNHFLGRISYNLNKVNDFFHSAISSIYSHLGTANGIATLDENGRIPFSQLPESAMEFKGTWNANMNTPHLVNGTGTKGDFYVCTVGGTVNFGSGAVTFSVNDRVLYDGSVWTKLGAGSVLKVNNIEPVNGNVTLPNGSMATMTLEAEVLTITIPE